MATEQLKRRDDIVITKPNKGSGVVRYWTPSKGIYPTYQF